LKAAQDKFHDEILKGCPNMRLAHHISALARALASAHWLREYWTPDYIEMLSQIPSEGELTRMIRELSRATTSVKERNIAFLIDKLCAGPPTRYSALHEPQEDFQPEDPIWSVSMDLDRERFREILGRMSWMDKTMATACVKRSGEEDDCFVQELNTIINDDTDQVCVNLARYFRPVAAKTGHRLDPCWKHLLMGMMRRRPRGLLDRLGEMQSLQSWQDWLSNLRYIYGEGHLDPEGQLGFTKSKIFQWQQRKISLSRADSDASTATRSTGSFSTGNDSFQRRNVHNDLGTPLTIPSPRLEPFTHAHLSQGQNKMPEVLAESVEIGPSARNGRGVPWYEQEIELLNAFKPSVTTDEKVPKISGGFVDDDEDIYN
jgi:hypothetical protein